MHQEALSESRHVSSDLICQHCSQQTTLKKTGGNNNSFITILFLIYVKTMKTAQSDMFSMISFSLCASCQ